jgi:uncharacterized NAD(P)/FAD-binding protein YdhS
LDAVPSGANVILVGTGLTMVDATLSLARDPNAKVTAVSRHGLLPQVHGDGMTLSTGGIAPSIMKARTLRQLVRAVRGAIAEECQRGRDWRSVIDSLRPATADLWSGLGPTEQRRFLRHVRPFWETHRHRIPRPSAEKLVSLMEGGRLAVRAGRIRNICRGCDGALEVAIDLSRKGGRINVRADVIFDCAGPALSVTDSTSEVIRGLLETGLATADPTGLGLNAEPTGEIISSNGCRTGIFAVGPLVRGLTYEATAVPELRLQAERTAAAIASQLAAARSGAVSSSSRRPFHSSRRPPTLSR